MAYRYDYRSFGFILTDWHQAVAPGDVDRFIRDELYLQGALSADDFRELLADAAVPSKALAFYLTARIRGSIATPLLARTRALSSIRNRDGRPEITVEAELLFRAREAALREILSSASAQGSGLSSSHFSEEPASPPLAKAARFCRHINGLTHRELIQHLGVNPPLAAAFERGYPCKPLLVAMVRKGFITNVESHLLAAVAKATAPVCGDKNAADVVRHFSKDGLTWTRYLRAAINYPQLFCQKPATLIANVEGVVEHFTKDGLARADYLRAVLRRPQLFCQKPSTLIANIEGVLAHFAGWGLIRGEYVRAATIRPALFYQKPVTLIANVEGVAARFNEDGLTLPQYLRAAIRQPQLFSQRPSTTFRKVMLLAESHDSLGTAQAVKLICNRPHLLVCSDEKLRLASQRLYPERTIISIA